MKLDVNSFEPLFGKWFPRFIPWLESKEAFDTYTTLKQRSANKAKIFPDHKKTFRAFELTDPSNINAIIVGQGPYHTLNRRGIPYADGLAFSTVYDDDIPPSLEEWYKALEREHQREFFRRGNLDYLAEQGVLLLNATFTCELGKASIHLDMEVWKSFNKFLYGEVLKSFCGIPVVCLGSYAEKATAQLFPMCHPIKYVEHPAYAARQKREWKTEGMFKWINETIEQNNGFHKLIEWDYQHHTTVPW